MNDHPTSTTNVEEHVEDSAKSSIALGAGMMLVGLLLGFVWAWLRFFHRGKSPRSGMVGSSGQVGKILLIELYFEFWFYLPEAIHALVRTFVSLSYIRVAMRKDVGRFESID